MDITFEAPLSSEPEWSVKCKGPDGEPVQVGEWIDRSDGSWTLRIPFRSDNNDVKTCYEKFGMPLSSTPRDLPEDLLTHRIDFMQEELEEYCEANTPGDSDRAAAFDALLDLVYVAHGTALLHGFPWAEGWARVQAANMAKEPGATGRFGRDLIKPAGWMPPDLSDLVATSVVVDGDLPQ